MKKMKKYSVIFYSLVLIFLFSCNAEIKLKKEKSNNQKKLNKCEVNQVFIRSELDLFQKDNQNLDSIIKTFNNEYPSLFQDTSLLRNVVFDENFNIIFDSVYVKFKNMTPLFDVINDGFCSLESYFPGQNLKIITLIDDDIVFTPSPPFNPIAYDYENNMILIQLQWFLGKNHVFYTNRNQPIPEYLTERYHQNFMPSMLFNRVASYYSLENNNTDLLTSMLNQAKPYLFTELMLPQLDDNLIFGSSQNDIDFFNQNVETVWKYILENQFLFSSESILKQHFIIPAQRTQIDTPGRFGVWIGWQILRSYYNNNDVNLQEVLKETNYLEVLNKSNYKP